MLKKLLLASALLFCGPALAATDHANVDGTKTTETYVARNEPTYRYAILAFAPVATPTDIVIIQGSATKVVHIKRIVLGGVATAAGNMPAVLIRRSSADTTTCVLTPITVGKHDSRDPTPTAVVSTIGTANCGVLGTSVGNIGAGRIQLSASGSGVAITPFTWDFSTRLDKAVILRGTSEFFAINLNGAAVPAGGVIDIEIETEEQM